MKLMTSVVAAAAMQIAPFAAQSQDLVFNGGFELTNNTIPPVGWTLVGVPELPPNPPYGVGNVNENDVFNPYEGSRLVILSAASPLVSGISQDLSTDVGKRYELSFAVSAEPGLACCGNGDYLTSPPAEMYATLNGTEVLRAPSVTSNDGYPYILLSYSFVAASSVTTLALLGQNTAAWWNVDSVGVLPAVPEPASYALFVAGLLSLLAIARKRSS